MLVVWQQCWNVVAVRDVTAVRYVTAVRDVMAVRECDSNVRA